MAIVSRGERQSFGAISNDISGLATIQRQVGGEGTSRWKMLMNGMHLEGHWNCVEYVVIEPGGSVGEHVHARTEEIYYIISGEAVMTMNGDEFLCVAGDLITTPIGASHAIRNDADEDMCFFVVEVFPGAGEAKPPARIHVRKGASVDIDLTPHFTGDWNRFRYLELGSGKSDDFTSPASTQVIHVLNGSAVIDAGGERYAGGAGLSVALPPRTSRRIENVDGAPLSVIVTEVTVR